MRIAYFYGPDPQRGRASGPLRMPYPGANRREDYLYRTAAQQANL